MENFPLKKTYSKKKHKGWLNDNYTSGKREENHIKAGKRGWHKISPNMAQNKPDLQHRETQAAGNSKSELLPED